MIFISCNAIYQLYESLTGFTNIPSYGFATMQCSSIYLYIYLHSTKAQKSVLNCSSLCQWHKSEQHCKWRKSVFITCVFDVSVTSNTCAIQYVLPGPVTSMTGWLGHMTKVPQMHQWTNLVDSFCQQIPYPLANLMFLENGKTDACLQISSTKFVIWNISGHVGTHSVSRC
jgi:hypothetical protein